MEHAAHLVDVLDTSGKIVGHKQRSALSKVHDIHHTIFTILVTPRGELVLSVIPAREDLPNLYARQIGATVATIRRTDESPLQAAHRGLSRELFIDDAEVHLLGRRMMTLPDSASILTTTYYLVADPPSTFSLIDIDTLVVIAPHQLRDILLNHPRELAPTFRQLWASYHDQLPV